MRRLALASLVLLLAAGGGEEPQQQRPVPPQQLAYPNAPTEMPTVVVVDGGSSIGEWAALATGVAALIAALEAFRRRRHRTPE